MNIIDIIILVALLYGLFIGFRKGFIHIVLGMAGFLAAIYVASRFAERLIPYLKQTWKLDDRTLLWIAYALLFIAVLMVVGILTKILDKIFDSAGLGWLNKLSGAALAALKYLIIIGLFFRLVDSFQERFGILPEDLTEDSQFYEPLSALTDTVIAYVGDLHISEWRLNEKHKSQTSDEQAEESTP